jgi:hypothetical protein
MPDHDFFCVCRECGKLNADQRRAKARAAYVREHAPRLLTAFIIDTREHGNLNALRKQAIEQAGLLFDESEVP